MTTVNILTEDRGRRIQVGRIELYGIGIDGATDEIEVPMDSDGNVIRSVCRCQPREMFWQVNVHRILGSIGQNVLSGRVGRYEWFAA